VLEASGGGASDTHTEAHHTQPIACDTAHKERDRGQEALSLLQNALSIIQAALAADPDPAASMDKLQELHDMQAQVGGGLGACCKTYELAVRWTLCRLICQIAEQQQHNNVWAFMKLAVEDW